MEWTLLPAGWPSCTRIVEEAPGLLAVVEGLAVVAVAAGRVCWRTGHSWAARARAREF